MLNKRSTQKEQLDNLDLAGEDLHQTLDGLSVINKYLGNTNATFNIVKKEILAANRSLKVIDLGCGGGDNLRSIAAWSAKNNYQVDLIGIDGNPNILTYATAKNTNQIQIEYLQADILSASFELPDCDILISSHFMYHFSDKALVHFLQQAKQKVTHKIIFSELHRSKFAYLLFRVGAVFLPFSKMIKQDGLLAIRRSFTKKELVSILQQTAIPRYQIQWKWAFRLLITIPTTK